MLPKTVTIKGVECERRLTAGDEVVYANPNSVFTISLREDSQGQIEEKLDCLIKLITITTGWVSFENNLVRDQFQNVVYSYYSQYSNEFDN